MQVLWAKEALDRLSEIEAFISNDSPQRAVDFTNFLIEQTVCLTNQPKIGRVVPEIGNESIRELIVKKYRVIYRIAHNKIEILTVFEGHRLLRVDELRGNI